MGVKLLEFFRFVAVAALPIAITIGDTPARGIIDAHFHPHPVAEQNTNVVFTHLSRKIRQNTVPVLQFNQELSIRKGFDYRTFNFDLIVSFCHTLLSQLLKQEMPLPSLSRGSGAFDYVFSKRLYPRISELTPCAADDVSDG